MSNMKASPICTNNIFVQRMIFCSYYISKLILLIQVSSELFHFSKGTSNFQLCTRALFAQIKNICANKS